MSQGVPSPPVLPGERYLVVPRIGQDLAEPRLVAEICEGPFRPPDAREAASIEALYSLFVPFWRVDIRRWDEAQRLEEQRKGYLGVPSGHDLGDATTAWMICASTSFPFEIKHPTSIVPSDAKPLLLHASSLRPGDPDQSHGWAVLDADVDEAAARALATASYRKLSLDANALFAQAEIAIYAIHFVRYPVWFARYRYRGQAAPTPDGAFHVGISAVDETCITALHPSKLLAGAARLRKLFGFNG
jgi:hypothetical protein